MTNDEIQMTNIRSQSACDWSFRLGSWSFKHLLFAVAFVAATLDIGAPESRAQDDAPKTAEEAVDKAEIEPEVADQVDVNPEAEDRDIAGRLKRILEASGLFQEIDVRVDEGVVFLTGRTKREEHRQKATDLANHTQDVVMTVNNIEIVKPSIWDFSGAQLQVKTLVRDLVQSLPMLLVTLGLLLITWYAAKAMRFVADGFFTKRVNNAILRQLLVRIFTILVYLVGIYLVLRIAGLTRLAATVLGGTGLLGLIIGIAFRDIAENFLASLLISLQRPFMPGDVIKVNENTGVVQNVTTRGTLLMTFDGNHVHIPNSTIYKSVVHNFTANPNTRFELLVGIDYGDHVAEAQDIAVKAMRSHSAVLDKPEPSVLVDNLGASTVNLKLWFWVNTKEYDGLKVRSAVIRKVKAAFEEAGLTMPDEAREIIFPKAVPVQMLSEQEKRTAAREEVKPKPTPADASDTSDAEGGLHSEAETIKEQAKQSRNLEAGTELLDGNADDGGEGQGSKGNDE